jgi:hypothetical protein
LGGTPPEPEFRMEEAPVAGAPLEPEQEERELAIGEFSRWTAVGMREAVMVLAAPIHAALDWTSSTPDALRGIPGAPTPVRVVRVVSATGLHGLPLARSSPGEAADTEGGALVVATPGSPLADSA